MRLLPTQNDLPAGETWLCGVCGTRLRAGQPHGGRFPWPHSTVGRLVCEEDLERPAPHEASPENAFSMRLLLPDVAASNIREVTLRHRRYE